MRHDGQDRKHHVRLRQPARALLLLVGRARLSARRLAAADEADLLAGGLTEADLDDRSVAQDPSGVGQRLFFQNRIHLDINSLSEGFPTPEQVDAEKDRIVGLGATVVLKYDKTWGPVREYHYVMQDPEGNEFCIH
jgi:hypothetical protein